MGDRQIDACFLASSVSQFLTIVLSVQGSEGCIFFLSSFLRIEILLEQCVVKDTAS